MYDILIGTPHSSSAASAGSHNKPGNYGSAPLPRLLWGEGDCFVKRAARFTPLNVRLFMCQQLFQSCFFPKVISPSNYNGAVVTMVVVRNQSRRYNPPSSAPPQWKFSISYSSWRWGILIRALNTPGAELKRLLEFTWSGWHRRCTAWVISALQEILPEQTFVHKCMLNLAQTHYNRYAVTVPITFTSSPHPYCRSQATSQPLSHSLLSVTLYLTETLVSSTNKSPLCHFCSFKCWKAIGFVFMIPKTKSGDQV